jgi:hypothetical protein
MPKCVCGHSGEVDDDTGVHPDRFCRIKGWFFNTWPDGWGIDVNGKIDLIACPKCHTVQAHRAKNWRLTPDEAEMVVKIR